MEFEYGVSLASVVAQVEEACASIAGLAAGRIRVESLPDFTSLPQATVAAIRDTPAAYIKSERRIIVNGAAFTPLPPPLQVAVPMHEVGHAHLHLRGQDDSCSEADIFVCGGPHGAALIAHRRAEYGTEYASALDLAVNGDLNGARAALARYRIERLVGLR